MKTFWLKQSLSKKGTSTSSSMGQDDDVEYEGPSVAAVSTSRPAAFEKNIQKLRTGKMSRLVDWNVDVLSKFLRQVVARRKAVLQMSLETEIATLPISPHGTASASTVLEEVKDILELPRFDPKIAKIQSDPEKVVLGEKVVSQLREYVSNVAAMYHDNPFHNFEHASHVTMSVSETYHLRLVL